VGEDKQNILAYFTALAQYSLVEITEIDEKNICPRGLFTDREALKRGLPNINREYHPRIRMTGILDSVYRPEF
jgi:hypothetical protein